MAARDVSNLSCLIDVLKPSAIDELFPAMQVYYDPVIIEVYRFTRIII